MDLKTLPKDGLPRERLFEHGPHVLSDADILALLIGTGASGLSNVELAAGLLGSHRSLRIMASRDVRDFMSKDGIGPSKAARLAAAFEIARRLPRQPKGAGVALRSPKAVFREYRSVMADLNREIFKVVLLNTAHVRIADFTASEGGLAASIVEPRLIFRRAILDHAAAIICIHNHPSGNPEPSREDISVTRQLVEAGRVVGIPLRDHVIIAADAFTSLAERGLVAGT